MDQTKMTPEATQLVMPGMPDAFHRRSIVSCCNIAPGQQVVYLGKIYGGPRYGTRGTVKQALQKKAVVDMGMLGVWNIPYYFLSAPFTKAA